jgi:hypothetical protein
MGGFTGREVGAVLMVRVWCRVERVYLGLLLLLLGGYYYWSSGQRWGRRVESWVDR